MSHRTKSLLSLLPAVGLFALIVWVSGPDDLSQVLDADPVYVVLVSVVTALIVVVATARWRRVLEALESSQHFPLVPLFRIVVVGLALGLVVSVDVGSASSRVLYLTKNKGMPLERAGYSTLFDRGLDVIVLAVGAPASVLFVAGLLDAPLASAVVLSSYGLALLTVAVHPNAIPSTTAWIFTAALFALSVVRRKRASRTSERRFGLSSLAPAQATLFLVLSLVRFGLVGARAWLVMLALGIDFSIVDVVLVLPLVQATLMVPFAPGGLGVYEAGWYGVLFASGVVSSDILVFVVLHRILSSLSVLVLFAAVELASLFRRAPRNELSD